MKTTEVRLKDGTKAMIHGDAGSLPILRLLQYHAPNLVIEVWRSEKDPIHVGIGMIDLDSPKTGIIHEPNPPKSETFHLHSSYDANGSPIKE